MKNTLFFFLALLFIISCQKETTENQVQLLAECTYFKVREGTEMIYNVTSSGKTSETKWLVEKLTTIDGKEFIEILATGQGFSAKQYFDCDGEKFIVGSQQDQAVGTGAINIFSIVFDLSKPIGQRLIMGNVTTTDGGFIEVVTYYSGEVKGRGLKKNVGGKSYSNITEFELYTITEYDGFEIGALRTKYYFIPEKGALFIEVTDNLTGKVTTTQSLKEFKF